MNESQLTGNNTLTLQLIVLIFLWLNLSSRLLVEYAMRLKHLMIRNQELINFLWSPSFYTCLCLLEN